MREMTNALAILTALAALEAEGVALIAGGADTEYLTGDAATVKKWATRLWVELPRVIYWSRFMRENDTNAIIEVKTDLEKGPGDKLTFALMRKLSGAGVTGDGSMEGSEESMTHYTDDITLDQTRNAVRLKGRLSERRTAFNQRDTAKQLLKTWMAETIDDDIFTQMATSASTVIYGGDATSTATVDSGDTVTTGLLDKAVAKAKKQLPKIWPVQVLGKQMYVVVLHTDVVYDLRQSTNWQNFQQNANIRGDENPIFNGMIGFHNGCVLHEHEKIPIVTNWGAASNQPGAQNFFLGRQAGLFGWGQRPQWWEKEFDYGNKTGFCIGAIWDMTKAVFNTTDNGYIELRTYRTNV